jgi:hypothetical protein
MNTDLEAHHSNLKINEHARHQYQKQLTSTTCVPSVASLCVACMEYKAVVSEHRPTNHDRSIILVCSLRIVSTSHFFTNSVLSNGTIFVNRSQSRVMQVPAHQHILLLCYCSIGCDQKPGSFPRAKRVPIICIMHFLAEYYTLKKTTFTWHHHDALLCSTIDDHSLYYS